MKGFVKNKRRHYPDTNVNQLILHLNINYNIVFRKYLFDDHLDKIFKETPSCIA